VNKPLQEPTKAPGAEIVERPSADPGWHPAAVAWFESLAASGQSHFYEPSDWATAYVLAESMSRELNPQPLVVGSGEEARVELYRLPPKAASVAAWLKGMTALMATEGDRRRAALELQRPQPAGSEEGGDVTHLDDVRARLGRPG
jgi:hypothetical protein